MGRGSSSPAGFRAIDGILLLDKSTGVSSSRALQQARHLFRARKAGHCGSLDPLATGVLPLCFGEATKFSSYLLDASKTYRATICLGQTSTTGDAEGEISRQEHSLPERDRVEQVLRGFVGEIEQIPPMHSAIKHEGKRLYQLARQGREVERKPRSIQIHALEMLSCEDDQLVIDVHCSKGTYIRTLAEDIGVALETGAYLSELRRTAVAPFWQQESFSIDQLGHLLEQGMDEIEALLLPVSAALIDFPEVILSESDCLQLQQGKVLQRDADKPEGILRLVSVEGVFIGLGEALDDGRLVAKRLMNTAG